MQHIKKEDMTRIKLKPNSAEYADNHSHSREKLCEMYGCDLKGDYKAPKHRGLNDHYHFCLDHVRQYNQTWNYFSGMSDDEVQDHVLNSLYGFRPTWKYGVNGDAADALRDKIRQTYNFSDDPPPRSEEHRRQASGFEAHSPEFQALAIMGLEPPLDLARLKTRYKELAKKHHPDLNKGCLKSEDLLKHINMAYTILKVAFQKFDDLPKR